MSADSTPIKLFLSYSHDDEAYFKIFSRGIEKVSKNAEHFKWTTWEDTKIHVGSFWDEEIQKNIQDCNIAMLLVTVGFMASDYIKEKEFKEFLERYERKGILIVPIVFGPCDFNRWEDLGRLQFFKPKGADYNKPDLLEFTYSDLFEFKKDGSVLPNPNIDRYHINLVKKVEDSYQEFLKRSIKMATTDLPVINTSRSNKLSDYPKPSPLFTGRKKEIEEFKRIIDTHRVIAIEGLGGTGKTEFAAKCIEELVEDKNRIIWLNGSSQSNFDVFVESAGYGDVLKGEKKTNLALYSGLKDLLEKEAKIIFWDNYNDYQDSAFVNFLNFANPYLQKTTIVLITRTEPAIERIVSIPAIKLDGLENDALEFAKKLRSSSDKYSQITDIDLEKICIGVDGHPLAIELSISLMVYGKSADEILLHMPEFSIIKKVEEFSRRLFLDIFNHINTTEEERDCFLKCSVFKDKFDEDGIKYLNNGQDVFHLLVGLIDKLLLVYKSGYYEIHPLVRSFAYEQLLDKKSINKYAAEWLSSKRLDVLNAYLEEKIFYHLSECGELSSIENYIEIDGRKFISQGQLGLLFEMINSVSRLEISKPVFDILLGDIMEIKGEWDTAINHYKKATQSFDVKIKVEGIIKHGEICFRKSENDEALAYFTKAYSLAKEHVLSKEEARALNDIGLVLTEYDDLDSAKNKLEEALNIRININDKEGIAASFNNIANIFSQKGKYDKALENYQKSLTISENLRDKIGIALYTRNKGFCLIKMNKLDEAYKAINYSLKLSREVGDKAGINYCLINIGNIFIKQGKLEKGLEKFDEGLKASEEIGDKKGVAFSLFNIGEFHLDEKKDYETAISIFLKSLITCKQIKYVSEERFIVKRLEIIKKEIGNKAFKENFINSYNKIDYGKNLINLNDFFNEPHIQESIKIGRNDPCSCGSGKKYKQCHGKN